MKYACAVLFGFMALFSSTDIVNGQESRGSERVEVVGVVVNRLTGDAIPGASVEITRLRWTVYADAEGRFKFGRVPVGTYPLVTRQLGYTTEEEELRVGEPVTLRIELEPEPILLEEVSATVELLKARRSVAPVSVQSYDQHQLRTTAAFDAAEFVFRRSYRLVLRGYPSWRARSGIFPVGSFGFEWTRGPAVFIDERPAPFGMLQLEVYRPDDFYLIEIYGGGRLIRAYTEGFVERLARGEARVLLPVWP